MCWRSPATLGAWKCRKAVRQICLPSLNCTRAHVIAFIHCARSGKKREWEWRTNKPTGGQAKLLQTILSVTEASVAVRHVRATKLIFKHYPVLWDVLSIEYLNVNKHAVVCSPLSDSDIVQVVRLRNDRVTFRAECHWRRNRLRHHGVQFCVFFGSESAQGTLRKVCNIQNILVNAAHLC